MLPILLAHGALGPYDELIFLGVAVIFVVMMGVSWVRSRNTQPPINDPPPTRDAPESDGPNHISLD
jgi:hypothetical protein